MTLELLAQASKCLRNQPSPKKHELELARLLEQVTYELNMAEVESDAVPTWLHAEIDNVAKSVTSTKIPRVSPSKYPHAVYVFNEPTTSYKSVRTMTKSPVLDITDPRAVLISSELLDPVSGKPNGRHSIAVDIDIPAKLVPSSTPDHYHLYIDREMSWRQYKKFLRAMVKAGVVEKGYYKISVRRGGSHLRLPWIKKEESEISEVF